MADPVLAIFDLDYTLTKRGTWGRFVVMNVKYRPHIWLPLLIVAGWTQWRYKQGKIPRIHVKQAMMKWAMVGMPRSKLTALAEEFAKKEVECGLKPGAVKTLRAHQEAGDTVMIASAAVDILVKPISRRLGVTHFVATDMGWTNEDKLSTNFASKNCYGEEKLSRIQCLIAQNPNLAPLHPAISYSDSKADLPLLSFTERGIAVDPNVKFQKLIKARPNICVESWK